MLLPRSHAHPPSRRRSAVGPPQLCAIAAALLLLLSLSVLHSRLSSSPLSLPSLPTLQSEDDSLHPDSKREDDESESESERKSSGSTSLSLDLIDELEIIESESDFKPKSESKSRSALIWDHILGVARLPFSSGSSNSDSDSDFDLSADSNSNSDSDFNFNRPLIAFSSDDFPIDEEIQIKLSSIRKIEDALLIKPEKGESVLREGWAKWLEGKGDFLRRNHMLHSNLELLNPKNHPLLQDPDLPGLTTLTRGDRFVQRVLLREMESSPFVSTGEKFNQRRELHTKEKEKEEDKKIELHVKEREEEKKEQKKIEKKKNGRRWGFFPGIDPTLKFSEFMEKFFEEERKCEIRVLMVWNSPQWTFGVRNQRGLESLFKHHKDACVVIFSETLDFEFFKDFNKDGFKVAVAMPNLDELLEGTPVKVFASVWFDWRKTRYYSLHYSELIRLAALYKYGGIYLDSDVIILKRLNLPQNSLGVSGEINGNSTYSGAIMSFDKNNEFVMECLTEFYSTYDDDLIKWNGADLLTRVINKLKINDQLNLNILPSFEYYPISSSNITRYFAEPGDETDKLEQDLLFKKIMEVSSTFHLWNGITYSLVPEPKSLVDRILNYFCLRCLDVI
ncbi:hypothetical protein LUZ60_005467 [Juncus effusus]|nr:hypothetical protein LUZ60_005467 [Juncus effusus]